MFGVTVGAVALGLIYLLFPGTFVQLAMTAGQKFESLEDLRRSISARESADYAAEGGVSLRAIIRPHQDDKIIYELEPNLTSQFRHVEVRTNSFGMRDLERPVAKAPDTVRVAILGDSYAFGWGVKQDQIFPRHLEQELARLVGSEKNIEVLNFGVPGYSTFQEVANFIDKGAQFKPDVVLVYFIHNDFALPFFIRDLRGTEGDSLATAFEFRQMQNPPDGTSPDPRRAALLKALDANRALLQLSLYCKEHGIYPFITIHPDEREEKLWPRLWVLRNAPGRDLLKPLKLTNEFRKVSTALALPPETLKLENDTHPGPGTHHVIGKALANLLYPELQRLNLVQAQPHEEPRRND
jgi:hypothetical protein